jgi:type IV secretory pathway protease TraF
MRIDRARLRLQIAVLLALSAANVMTLIAFDVRVPLVIYNASGSAPLGFYRLEKRLPRRGEMAATAGDRIDADRKRNPALVSAVGKADRGNWRR